MQIILHFSQTVDMFTLGDTSTEREEQLLNRIDELETEIFKLNSDLVKE